MSKQVSILSGDALDWAVAKCEGLTDENGWTALEIFNASRCGGSNRYSTDWSQAGPIIEREGITVFCTDDYEWAAAYGATQYFKDEMQTAPTPLIAAMRCYVTNKAGATIKIPKELL